MNKLIPNKGNFRISNESEESLKLIRKELAKKRPNKRVIFESLSGTKYNQQIRGKQCYSQIHKLNKLKHGKIRNWNKSECKIHT